MKIDFHESSHIEYGFKARPYKKYSFQTCFFKKKLTLVKLTLPFKFLCRNSNKFRLLKMDSLPSTSTENSNHRSSIEDGLHSNPINRSTFCSKLVYTPKTSRLKIYFLQSSSIEIYSLQSSSSEMLFRARLLNINSITRSSIGITFKARPLEMSSIQISSKEANSV